MVGMKAWPSGQDIDGSELGIPDGGEVGEVLGADDRLGSEVKGEDSIAEGSDDGKLEGALLGSDEGEEEGIVEGDKLGMLLGTSLGIADGAVVHSLAFPLQASEPMQSFEILEIIPLHPAAS